VRFVALGGTGRAIVGKVVVIPPGEKVDWSLVQMRARANNRSYIPSLAGDGSFRVDDIPAGACQLSIDARERSTGLLPFADVGEVERDVLVLEMPCGRSDEPLDVGTIEVPIHHLPAAGVEAADFAVKTLDGQPLKLSDYRGKFILLDLARKLPGTETPSVEAAAQDFATATNFAVITLCNDADPDFLAALFEKKLPWIIGKLGDLNLPIYGVSQSLGFIGASGGFGGGGPDLPAVLLIGPDGKYVDGRLKAAGIQDAVKAALGAK
jgi:peroxiredoxin